MTFELKHHPAASREYRESLDYFTSIDASLADAFTGDFAAALRELASGRAVSALHNGEGSLRWVKLRRFSHKIFFEPAGDDTLLVLGVISGKRAPQLISRRLRVRKVDLEA